MFKISYVHIFDIDLEQLKKKPILHCCINAKPFANLQMVAGGKTAIASGLVGGFLQMHHEGKLSLPLG